MIKIITTIVFFLTYVSTIVAQTELEARKVLLNVNSLDEIDSLKKAFPDWDIHIGETSAKGLVSFNSIIKSKIGDICTAPDLNNTGVFVHKLFERKKEEHCRVQIIFLHGENRTAKELDSIGSIIIKKYAEGISFKTLHDEYNEDGNSTGLLDWFFRGIMVKEFDDIVFSKKKKEIFKVNVTIVPWYFIVLKTNKNEKIKVTYSIRVKIKE